MNTVLQNKAVIIVPIFNERKRFREDEFLKFENGDVGFLFVDDGSTDNSASMIEGLKSKFPAKFDLLSLPENLGKAEAVRQGFLKALPMQPHYIGYWDADLATPLSAISEFIQIFEGNSNIQLVTGARVKLLGRDIQRNIIRHYLGRIFATAASLVLNLPIYDTQCGAKLFRTQPWLNEIFAERFLGRWVFDVEMLARFAKIRPDGIEQLIYECPLKQWHDIKGSKLKLTDFFWAFLDLVRISRKYG
jgi:glycosyltransferase involved in cell wall biosynthesis